MKTRQPSRTTNPCGWLLLAGTAAWLTLAPTAAGAGRTRYVSSPVSRPVIGGGASGHGSSDWSGPVGSTVHLRVRMPPWTEGWLRAGVAWVGATPPASQAKLTGRDIEAVSNHVLLMRTKASIDGPHAWSAAALGHPSRPWEAKVYQAPWPKVADLSGFQPGQNGQTATVKDQEYQRYSSYVNWSD